MALKLRRGTDAERQNIVFAEGEPVYVTDTGELYVGDGVTEGGKRIRSGLSAETDPSLGGNLDLAGNNIVGTGNIAIDGNITASGTISLGDNVDDDIIVTGRIEGSLIPDSASLFDIGSSLNPWANGFFDSLTVQSAIDVETVTLTNIKPQDSTVISIQGIIEIDGFVNNDIVPEFSGKDSIGLDSSRYFAGYFNNLNVSDNIVSNILFIDTIFPNDSGIVKLQSNLEVGGNLLPDTTFFSSLGADDQRWSSGFFESLDVQNYSVENITIDTLLPQDSSFINIRANVELNGDLIPEFNFGSNIGTDDQRYDNVYTNNLDANIATLGNLTTDSLTTDSLTTDSFTTESIASTNAIIDTLLPQDSSFINIRANVELNGDLIPEFNFGSNIGTDDQRYDNVYTNNIRSTTAIIETLLPRDSSFISINGDLIPALDGQTTLGSPASKYGTIYSNSILTESIEGNFQGSVFAENSDLIIDGETGTINTELLRTNNFEPTVANNKFTFDALVSDEPGTLQLISSQESVLRLERNEPDSTHDTSTKFSQIEFRGVDQNGLDLSGIILHRKSEFVISVGDFTEEKTFKIATSTGNFGLGKEPSDAKLHVGGEIVADGFVQLGYYTQAERDNISAVNGMIIYNTTDNKFQGYENGSWVNLV